MSSITSRIITWSFFILFAFTPLFYCAQNSELFEFNKMRLVYGLTIIIATAWIVRMLQARQFLFRRTPLDIPLLLFLVSQIISTVISMDVHTSIWGYYSRSNGGLLSIISYITLYYALVSNYRGAETLKFLKAAILGGLLVSLYAIPEHFGVSPSCIWLTNTFSADCWVQDVQARVFASMGQPNWLAAYLAMIIFPAFYFFISSNRFNQKLFYGFSSLAMYLAFTFTFSRGGTLGFLAGLGVFGLFVYLQNRHPRPDRGSAQRVLKSDSRPLRSEASLRPRDTGYSIAAHANESGTYTSLVLKPFYLIVGGIIVINLLFGSALTGAFRLIKQNAPPPRPGLTGQSAPSGTQLENGGTESGQIRLIVWKGALDIFRHYPLFGSGVETYAYSYYQFRPIEHNLVSEWDFLYNKAHNEYLNYLATTGFVGFGSYMLLILGFLLWSLTKVSNFKLTFFQNANLKELALPTEQKVLLVSLLAGYISYLVQNIFSFSVVMIALLFFLFPAMAIAFSESSYELDKSFMRYLSFASPLTRFIYRRQLYTRTAIFFVVLVGLLYIFKVYQNWEADTFYKRANDLVDSGYVGEGFNTFIDAVALNSNEPLYRSEFGFAAAAAAVSHQEVDATEAARIKNIAIMQTERSLEMSPKNTSLWRTAIRTYYQLASFDPAFADKTIETIDQTIRLAPTDAKLYFNKGLILASEKKTPEAISALEKAIEMKPNYRDALITLADFYFENKQKEKAIETANRVLILIPNDQDATKQLEKFQKK